MRNTKTEAAAKRRSNTAEARSSGLLTIQEVAMSLGVSKSKVYTLLDSGAFPRFHLSSQRCARVHPDDLHTYIETLRAKAYSG